MTDQARLSLVFCSMLLLDTTRPTRRLCPMPSRMVLGYHGVVRWQQHNPKTYTRPRALATNATRGALPLHTPAQLV